MNFKYIWAIIKTQKKLPRGAFFQDKNLDNVGYIFYPFQHNENIFTADLSVWKSNQNTANNSTNALEEISYWPSAIKIKNFIKDKINSNSKSFIILFNKSCAQTIDANYAAPLVDLSEIAEFKKDFSFLGYDVIDISGLSALANIGYSRHEVLEINNAKIEINNFGIISSLNDAVKLVTIADLFANEHAPFSPVEVWGANSVLNDKTNML